MSSSPFTPSPMARFPSPRVPSTSFDVLDALKRQDGACFSLSEEQVAFCKNAIVQLKEKMVTSGLRTPIDKEFDELSDKRLISHQIAMQMSAARLAKNQQKNRYVNVLPFDDTRVKLAPDNGSAILSDYINASFIMDPVHASVPVFIATQGPLKSTIIDFWQMVMQQKCPAIIMLTRLVDGDQQRCAHYYPTGVNQSHVYGQLRVTTKCTSYLQSHLTLQRIIEVQNVKDSQVPPHTLIHFEYLDWPDFGVPSSTAPVREMIRTLHCIPASAGPIVVHCSAGVGRTGTFCTIDHSIRRVLLGDVTALDISQTVRQFRSQRSGMVQTKDQNRFIYEAVVDELEYLDQNRFIYEAVVDELEYLVKFGDDIGTDLIKLHTKPYSEGGTTSHPLSAGRGHD